jgi:hypothetical protein
MAGFWGTEDVKPLIQWGNEIAGGQVWRGNIYLNYFCVDGVNSDCFEVIKREFSHSSKLYRRYIQSAYVRIAIRPPVRNWLSQVKFSVLPAVPNAEEVLLIGGNRRLRIIHPSDNKSYVIQKDGFSRLGFNREVVARKGYAASVAPRFHGIDKDGNSFSEAYFVGTPVNRFPPKIQGIHRKEAIIRLVETVHKPSLRTVSISDYLDMLSKRIDDMAPSLRDAIHGLNDHICESVGNESVGLVFSHGDFQDANILVNKDHLHIIDWESATERSQLYDLATMCSGMRMTESRFNTWKQTTQQWLGGEYHFPELLVRAEERELKMALAGIWWIEEVIFQLEEVHASDYFQSVLAEKCIQEQTLKVSQYLINL